MTLSAIIPTHNEAGNIAQVVRDLQTYGGTQLLEILVIDAHSTDGTADIARQAGARVCQSPKPGRAAQMNFGASQASGDVLYFVHADVRIHPDFMQDIAQSVAGRLRCGLLPVSLQLRKADVALQQLRNAVSGSDEPRGRPDPVHDPFPI